MIIDAGYRPPDYWKHFREIQQLAEVAAHILKPGKIPGWQTALCCKYPFKSKKVNVTVHRHKKSGNVIQKGLVNCGRYSCARCAPWLLHRIRKRLDTAIDSWRLNHFGKFLFLSCTIPHSPGESELEIKRRLDKTKKDFFNRTAWRVFRKKIGYRYRVVVREVMYGKNGPHPHIHILIFCRSNDLSHKDVTNLKHAWMDAYPTNGMPWDRPTYENGLVVSVPPENFSMASYMTKWGLGSEVTRSDHKKGKGSYTLWDLLRLARHGNVRAGQWFRDHFIAMFGQKIFSTSRKLYVDLLRQEPEPEEGEAQVENEIGEDAYEYIGSITDIWEKMTRYRQFWRLQKSVYKAGVQGLHFFKRFLARFDEKLEQERMGYYAGRLQEYMA